jgi:hypothetical protein
MNPFRDLDDRFLPTLARWADRVIPKPPPPTGPLPVILRLRAVDDRWTADGPLALLREVPQLGAVAIAALVLASGITVASRSHPASRAEGTQQEADTCGASGGRLGPQLGDSVPAYVDAARSRLQRAAACQPDGVAVGVVSFSRYVTVATAQQLVGPSTIRKVFYRVPLPLPQTDARSVAVGADVAADLYKEFERIARAQLAEANELLKVAATITNDPAQKKQNETDAAIYRREAAQLRAHCACVFAVVVESKLRVLDALGAIPGVRAVDAGRGRLEAFDYTALLPDETVTATGGDQASS